ncbi:MAG: hypothetical protein CBD16_07255 [Betaproteobacteria bacterium TMED156]|nr:MAG: hypothetical protein CBD16_07255 [Betaproteobacteria bacterium TMED156]
MIVFNSYWLSKIRDRILLNAKFRNYFENTWVFKPFVKSQANQIFDLVSGFVYSQILFACISLDLLEKLRGGPVKLSNLAEICSVDLPEMQRLIDGAKALGIVETRENDLIGLGIKGILILTKPSISALIKHHSTFYKDLIDPVALLRKQRNSTALGSFWPYASNEKHEDFCFSEEIIRNYSEVMSISQPLVSEQICSAYKFYKHKKILDLGGGQATFAINLAKKYPNLKISVFDLPQVSKIAGEKICNSGFESQIKVYQGSFLRDPIPKGYDLITLIRVLYDHPDKNLKVILASAKKSLQTSGKLLIAEPMAGEAGTGRMSDAYFGMYLLAMGKGLPRSHKRIHFLLKEAGFSSVRSIKVTLPIQTGLIVAEA